MIILLHSSKTMRSGKPAAQAKAQHVKLQENEQPSTAPQLFAQATQLGMYLKTLSDTELARAMHLSPGLATKTHALVAAWQTKPEAPLPAIDSFVGDIYSGLQASQLNAADRDYAQTHLYILSGLYGCLRPLDMVMPYRLEMGYKFAAPAYANLYKFWGERVAACLPAHEPIINLSSVEYSRLVLPFVDPAGVITPRFLTADAKTGEPTFVVVHAKIARGAFARWLIVQRAKTPAQLHEFTDLGYAYDANLSTPAEPVFICKTFGGKGLSMRLQPANTPPKS